MIEKKKLHVKTGIVPVLFMLLIIVLALIPMGGIKSRIKESFGFLLSLKSHIHKTLDIEVAFAWIQNFLHIPFFALLAFLWMKFFNYRKMTPKKAISYTLVITLLFSLFEEFCQIFISGRNASILDLFLNLSGSIIGITMYCFLSKKNPREL